VKRATAAGGPLRVAQSVLLIERLTRLLAHSTAGTPSGPTYLTQEQPSAGCAHGRAVLQNPR
jgi:hypothetical protein